MESGKFSTFWGSSVAVEVAQLSLETEKAIAALLQHGAHHIKPAVFDRIPILTTKQTEEIRSQTARHAGVLGAKADVAKDSLEETSDGLLERFNNLSGNQALIVSAATKVYEDMAARASERDSKAEELNGSQRALVQVANQVLQEVVFEDVPEEFRAATAQLKPGRTAGSVPWQCLMVMI